MKAVFCSKCGTKLDEHTGRCSRCDTGKGNINNGSQVNNIYDKTAFYDSDMYSSVQNKGNGKKKKNIRILVAVLVLCFVFVFTGVVSFIVFFDSDITVFSSVFNNDDNNSKDTDNSLNKQPAGEDSASGTKGNYEESDVPEGAVSFNGHKYYVIEDPSVTDWNSAKRYCENRNGYLATITTQAENDFVYNYLYDNFDFSSVYFGMSDRSAEGEWKWANGEKVSFSNWATSEPGNNNSTFDYARFCFGREDGKWFAGGFDEASQEHIDVAVISTTATSVLAEENIIHDPDKIADGLLATSWVEGVSGYGIGEAVTLNFAGFYNIDGFVINAGYQRSQRLYDKNSRPSEIRLTFSDGTSETFLLDDVFRSQHISLSEPVMTDSVTLTILASYRGTSFEDTSIAEISFSAVESNPMFLCEWGNY